MKMKSGESSSPPRAVAGGAVCLPEAGGFCKAKQAEEREAPQKATGTPILGGTENGHSPQPTGQGGESSAQEPRGCRARRRCGTDRQTPEQPWSRAGAVRPVHHWGPVPRTVTQSWRETARDQTDQTRGRTEGRGREGAAPWGTHPGLGRPVERPRATEAGRPWGPRRSRALSTGENPQSGSGGQEGLRQGPNGRP